MSGWAGLALFVSCCSLAVSLAMLRHVLLTIDRAWDSGREFGKREAARAKREVRDGS